MAPQTPDSLFPTAFLKDNLAVQMPSRLTVLEAITFKQACHELLDIEPLPRKILLDFQQTEFIDSSGIGALVHNFKAAQKRGTQLILINVSTPVMATLSMTGLDEVLRIFPLPEDRRETLTRNFSVNLPETHPSVNSPIKRAIDIAGSLVGLGITAILFIPIAIAIKWDSPGPIFFTQTRCGWMGRRFKIIKFRSMYVNAEAKKEAVSNQVKGPFFKNENDPRITRVGRFLRRKSWDELPQFWNVLKGEMSLVGTRPPTPDEVDYYDVPSWQRLDVKPGMTGEWQVSGRSRVRDFEEVIRLDLRYQQNWSLQYDLQLIFKTFILLFKDSRDAF